MPLITEELPNITEIQEKIIEQTKQAQVQDTPMPTPTVNVNDINNLCLIGLVIILAAILIKYINVIIKLLIIACICILAYKFLI